jgi:uracil phosphoribosyltransferase
MGSVCVLDHPLIQHKLSLIRDENTNSKEFRSLVEEVAMLMAYEVTRDFPLEDIEVQTPVGLAKRKKFPAAKSRLFPYCEPGWEW